MLPLKELRTMCIGTFKHLYKQSALYLSGLKQTIGIGAIRRMFRRKRWRRLGKHAQRRTDKDRTDSLIILENRLERKDITKVEYEIMKSVLIGNKEAGENYEATN